MIKHKKLPKYGFGATLQAVSPFLNAIPGVGQIASLGASLIGGVIESEEQKKEAIKNQIKTPTSISTNPYMGQYKMGGEVNGFKQYSAPSHENGGQPINSEGQVDMTNPSAEIEGTENKYKYSNIDNKTYIFSDKNRTSELVRSIMSKYKNKNVDTDSTVKNAMELQIKAVEKLNDKINEIQEVPQEQAEMSGGGGLNVLTLRKEQKKQKQLPYGGDPTEGVPSGVPYQLGLNNPAYQGQPMLLPPSPFKLRIQNQLPTIPSYNTNQPSLNNLDIPQGNNTSNSSSGVNNGLFSNIKMPNMSYGKLADGLKTGLALFDTIKAATAKPDKVDARLADYTKSDAAMYNQNVDLTQAQQNAQAASNVGVNQINDGTTSQSTRMARLQGLNANLQNTYGNLSLQGQQMKNAINQSLGQYEGAKAQDNSNRQTNADDKFAQNTAASRMLTDTARQTLASLGQDYQNKDNRDKQIEHVTQMAKLKGAEGFALLKSMVTNFQMDASKEWNDYVSNPSDANLEKLRTQMKITVK